MIMITFLHLVKQFHIFLLVYSTRCPNFTYLYIPPLKKHYLSLHSLLVFFSHTHYKIHLPLWSSSSLSASNIVSSANRHATTTQLTPFNFLLLLFPLWLSFSSYNYPWKYWTAMATSHPCPTPNPMAKLSLSSPSTLTHALASLQKALTPSSNCPLTPYIFRALHRASLSILSYGFSRSMKAVYNFLPFYKYSSKIIIIADCWSTQPFPFLNPPSSLLTFPPVTSINLCQNSLIYFWQTKKTYSLIVITTTFAFLHSSGTSLCLHAQSHINNIHSISSSMLSHFYCYSIYLHLRFATL